MQLHLCKQGNYAIAPVLCVLLQVFLTSTHLGIAMEYAAGGELFDRIVKAGRFSEDEARYFFQQLISGVDYCHSEVSSHTNQRHCSLQTVKAADGSSS